MAIYRIANGENSTKFEPIPKTSFEAEGIRERDDLQRMLSVQPDVLEEGLFILADEYGDWEESKRRIDLLALDNEGRLVVVELKRSDLEDTHMELQAVRYAALVANMTLEQAIDAHRMYLSRWNIEGDAESRVLDHLGGDDEDVLINSENPRIILASANFSKELTTSVLWLNQVGLDVTCIKLQPCKKEGDSVLVERSQVIPIPEAADYTIRLRNRETERQEASQVKTHSGADAFLESIQTAVEKDKLEKLCKMATDLEEEGLAELFTSEGARRTTLRVVLPGRDLGLVNVIKYGAYCNLQLNTNQFDQYAPKAKARLDDEVVKGQWRLRYWPNIDAFLKILPEAYREANGASTQNGERRHDYGHPPV